MKQASTKHRTKVLGKNHKKTGVSYYNLRATQYVLRDYTSATESQNWALSIKEKVLGEDHKKTADCYRDLGIIQYLLTDYTSATESHKRALNMIRQKRLGEGHAKTSDSYISWGLPNICLKITPQPLNQTSEH